MEIREPTANEQVLNLNRNREIVMCDYQSASVKNIEQFYNGDVMASSEYIFENQKLDALTIMNTFYNDCDKRVCSIVKRTKVGMDGLMIELAKNMSTHPDNNFVIHRRNIFFITAMNNLTWERDMKAKSPECFRENIFHHGQLQKLKLKNLKNAIIINDEIDSGDKENQKLHTLLKESGLLDVNYMKENNIRFIFVSATMINELHELFKWNNTHFTHYMTIPSNYIGHKEFLELGIIQEFYPITSSQSAEKWIQEDILLNYGNDHRVHIVRTDKKNIVHIHNACIRNNIDFKNHTSDDRITYDELAYIFNNITNHVVIAVKGFYRRANLIPDEWKKKIGATHEKFVKKCDTSVQIQGLPGRMTGFWYPDILNGHKTGPHRTSINAIKEYEEFYNNPFGRIKYTTTGSNKTFVNPKHIGNLEVEPYVNTTNMRVPIIISGLNENDIIFNTTIKAEKEAFVISTLVNKHEYSMLYNFIQNPLVKCIQISKPQANSSYNKHIIHVVNASLRNIPYSIDLSEDNKRVNNWQLFIDNRKRRLCFVVWSLDETMY